MGLVEIVRSANPIISSISVPCRPFKNGSSILSVKGREKQGYQLDGKAIQSQNRRSNNCKKRAAREPKHLNKEIADS